MDVAGYVSRYMLFEICDVAMVRNEQFDRICNHLYDYFVRYISNSYYRHLLTTGLPSIKTNKADVIRDMNQLYTSIIRGAEDHHSISTIRCLFAVSIYMMKRYEDDISLCSLIPFSFELISSRLRGWSYFDNRYESGL